MATIKSYSDLQQSKKLAEILPLESADMSYMSYDNHITLCPYNRMMSDGFYEDEVIPCWSLAELLKCLSEIKPQVYTPTLFPSEGKWILHFVEYGHGIVCAVTCDNPVDACCEIIVKLNELKIL